MLLLLIAGGLGLVVLHHTSPSNSNSAGASGAAGQPATSTSGAVSANAQKTNNPASAQASRVQNQNQPWYTGTDISKSLPALEGLFSQGANSIAGLFGSNSSDGIEEQVDMTGVEMPDDVDFAFDDAGESGSGSSFDDEEYYDDSGDIWT